MASGSNGLMIFFIFFFSGERPYPSSPSESSELADRRRRVNGGCDGGGLADVTITEGCIAIAIGIAIGIGIEGVECGISAILAVTVMDVCSTCPPFPSPLGEGSIAGYVEPMDESFPTRLRNI